MQIIFGKEVAQEMSNRHVLLELETFDAPIRGPVTAYCLVPPESISIDELKDLSRLVGLHKATIDALQRGDFLTVVEGISHLRGVFNGEVDSFYDVLLARLTEGETNV